MFTEEHRNGEFSVTREAVGRYFLWRDDSACGRVTHGTATARAHCGTFDFPEDAELARQLAIDACDRRARTSA